MMHQFMSNLPTPGIHVRTELAEPCEDWNLDDDVPEAMFVDEDVFPKCYINQKYYCNVMGSLAPDPPSKSK